MQRLVRNHFRSAKPVSRGNGNLFEPPAEGPQIDGNWGRPQSDGVSLLLGASLAAAVAGGLYLTMRRLPTPHP